VTCSFRFEVRPEDQVVELVDEHRHSALVCMDCLVLLTVHRRVHRMKVEKVTAEMAELGPETREAKKSFSARPLG
jgi:hypothetical protein